MNTDCANCKHGYTVTGPATITTSSGKTFIQNVGTSTTCMRPGGVISMTITDDGMTCADFEPREAEGTRCEAE